MKNFRSVFLANRNYYGPPCCCQGRVASLLMLLNKDKKVNIGVPRGALAFCLGQPLVSRACSFALYSGCIVKAK